VAFLWSPSSFRSGSSAVGWRRPKGPAKEIRLAGNAGGDYDPLDNVRVDEAMEIRKPVRNVFTFLHEAAARLKRQRT
jgi:hypothetical protein